MLYVTKHLMELMMGRSGKLWLLKRIRTNESDRCGWHESTSDGGNHATVDYKIRLPNGGTEDMTKHIYP